MAAEKPGRGSYADVGDLFCTRKIFPAIVGYPLVFRDDNHLTPEYAAFLGPVMAAVVARARPAS